MKSVIEGDISAIITIEIFLCCDHAKGRPNFQVMIVDKVSNWHDFKQCEKHRELNPSQINLKEYMQLQRPIQIITWMTLQLPISGTDISCGQINNLFLT